MRRRDESGGRGLIAIAVAIVFTTAIIVTKDADLVWGFLFILMLVLM